LEASGGGSRWLGLLLFVDVSFDRLRSVAAGCDLHLARLALLGDRIVSVSTSSS
jgi:hypothetical protein